MPSFSALQRFVTRSRFMVAVTALLALIMAAATKLGAVWLLLRVGVEPMVLQGQDALITGILAACFVGVVLAAERAQRKEKKNQRDVMADLNHDVRNALDVIVCSEYQGSRRATAILDSVARINRALAGMTRPIPQQPDRRAGLDK